MPDDFVPQLFVSLNGTDMAAEAYDALVEVRAESSTQLPDQARLRFIDPEFELFDQELFSIGDRVKVAITDQGVPQALTECEITSLAMEPGSNGTMTLVVTALGAAHRLYRGVQLATYIDQSDSDIATTIADKAGLKASVDSSQTRYPHVMQAAPNNRFLDERAERIGYRWWVEGDTLHFKQAVSEGAGTTLRWGEDIISLRMICSSADSTSEATVRAWNPDTQEAIVGTASSKTDLDFLGTDAQGPLAAVRASRALSTLGRFQATRTTADVTAASAMADGLCRRAASGEVMLRGAAKGTPGLRAGATVEITDAGRRLSGRYRLATVEHVYTPADGYITRFASGGQDPSGLVDLLGGRSSVTPWNAQQLVIGIVTNIEDPERPARVKVRFPSFSDTFESAWARVAMPGAGTDRGLQILPEIDDEVLVGFEHGDPQRPIVLGGLWSKKLTPPLATSAVVRQGKVASRVWKSRSGHSIILNDAEAEAPDSIVVSLKGGTSVLTIGKESVTLKSDKDVKITTDGAFAVEATGDISIKGANVKLAATSKMQIDGAQVAVKGTTTASLEAATLDVKASAKLGLDGGGITELKGGMVKFN